LVGREAELASIDDAAARAAHRAPPTPIAIVGLRGLGKTVLLNAVRRRTPGTVHLHVEVENKVPLATLLRG
jgi:Cdc6-like AAA superfamily ATPase